MRLRPYQEAAKRAVLEQWNAGARSTLMVLPTGTGKTIVFSSIIEECVRTGGRCLVLAHREELLNQAADKLAKLTGLGCAVEKAASTAVDTWFNVVVGSVQTMQREHRRIGHDFTHIIVDEAHHAVSASYRAVIDDFPEAKVLGVTATADRGDKRNLGEVFDTLAFEYSLPRAIRDGWLAPIKALTIPLDIDLAGCKVTGGDFQIADLGSALDPYLHQIADHIQAECMGRKTVVFLPLVATSQRFADMLIERGMMVREVNGESTDRRETLEWFAGAGRGSVLCNAMLLTEGWDQPDVDCIVVLRPTKVRGLYCQMVGRGTRPAPGKDNLLLLDFLWHSERHELCRPAHLICEDQAISRRVAELLAEDSKGAAVDLMEAGEKAAGTATEEREEALRKLLEEQKRRQRALVDPLQYEMSIDPAARADYLPDLSNMKALAPPSKAQLDALEKSGICPDEITCTGHASKLLDTLRKRQIEGMTTPKQIRVLERFGFLNVGGWAKESAKKMIDRVAANGWRIPHGVIPSKHVPAAGGEMSW